MKYSKTELKNLIDSTFEKDGKAKTAEGVADDTGAFRITNIGAQVRIKADLLCRMQDQLEICKDVYEDVDGFNVYEQAWRGLVELLEFDVEFYDRRMDEIIEGGK